MADEVDDWAAWADLRARNNDILAGLKAGSQGSGAWLTAADFAMVLEVMQVLKLPPAPNHRPAAPEQFYRELFIAKHCLDLEDHGKPLKNAVDSTAEKFGCKKSTVYASRKKYGLIARRLIKSQT